MSGFTLIEMLVVIIIISFLIGIILTGTLGFQASARDTRRIGDLRNSQNFLELYFNTCGHYPGTANCNDAVVGGQIAWDTLRGVMVPKITSQFPKGISGKNYFYGVSSNGLSYTLGAELERDNSVLQDDIDSTSNGVDCADLVYCISSS
ncbi:MAG: prepilin-type N-terminal cleavage/methylation domain-containing protein [Candidatus Colwellbacteria bacterium]